MGCTEDVFSLVFGQGNGDSFWSGTLALYIYIVFSSPLLLHSTPKLVMAAMSLGEEGQRNPGTLPISVYSLSGMWKQKLTLCTPHSHILCVPLTYSRPAEICHSWCEKACTQKASNGEVLLGESMGRCTRLRMLKNKQRRIEMELQGKFPALCCASREAAQDSGISCPAVIPCPKLLVAFWSSQSLFLLPHHLC